MEDIHKAYLKLRKLEVALKENDSHFGKYWAKNPYMVKYSLKKMIEVFGNIFNMQLYFETVMGIKLSVNVFHTYGDTYGGSDVHSMEMRVV